MNRQVMVTVLMTLTILLMLMSCPVYSSCNIILPPHHPCSSHTLSLIAVSDVEGALSTNVSYKRLYNYTMAKCSALWSVPPGHWNATKQLKALFVEGLISHVQRGGMLCMCLRHCELTWKPMYKLLSIVSKIKVLKKHLLLEKYIWKVFCILLSPTKY